MAYIALWLLVSMGSLLSWNAYGQWREVVPQAEPLGAGEMRYFGLSLYKATLWSSAQAREVATLSQPFALQLNYTRSISRQALVEASLKEIRRLVAPAPTAEQLARWQNEMLQAFVDVDKGDQITGVYVPEQGARFYVGDTLQHEINDPEFARAFFSIWLSPHSQSPSLRAQLLGWKEP